MKKEVGKNSRLYLHLQTSMTSVPNTTVNESGSSSSPHCSESSPADESLGGDFEKLSFGLNQNIEPQNVANVKEMDRLCQAAPLWFSSYMEKMQDNLRFLIHQEVQQCFKEFLKENSMWFPSALSNDPSGLLHAEEVSEPPMGSVRPKKAVTTSEPLHLGITCDHCEQPVSGIRFKCGNCVDYDLCEGCESIPGVHQPDHVFLKIRRPTSLATCRQKGERRIALLRHLYPQLGQVLTQETTNESVFRSRKREKKVKRWLSHAENFFNGHLGQERRSHRTAMLSGSRSTAHPLSTTHLHALHSRHNAPSQSKIQALSMKCLTEVSPTAAIFVQPGQEFEKEWRIRNDSQEPFSSSYRLRFSWGSLMPQGHVEVDVPPLWPGEIGTVGPVRFRAPQQEGIYHSHWLLVSHPGGMPFPWPSLSCPVHVSRQETPQENSQDRDTGSISKATILETVSAIVTEPKHVTVKADCDTTVQRSLTSNNNTTGPEESDDTASILSISSCDSDDDYVKVQDPTQLCFSTSTLLTKRHMDLQSADVRVESQATSSSSIDLLSDMPILEEETGQRQLPEVCGPHILPHSKQVSKTCSTPNSTSHSLNENHFALGSEFVSQETGAPEVAEFNDNHRQHLENHNRSDRAQLPRADHINRQESVIPVLPEGLMTGALTAAASVYNTAKALISNLQAPIDGSSEHGSQPSQGPPGPMSLLIEMGFHDRDLNQRLITEKGGRLEDVVAELIRRRPDHSLHID